MLLALSARLYACPLACRFGVEADTFFAAVKFVTGPKIMRAIEKEMEKFRKSKAIKMHTFGDVGWCGFLRLSR